MYCNNKYDVEIKIDLENGIYVFDDKSATGKTRLRKQLQELQKLGEPVIGYTYNDDKLGIDLVSQYIKIKPKVVLFDRYDMYNGMFNGQITNWAKDSIILIDCKGELNVNCNIDWCYIEMSPDVIEVAQ